MSKSALCVYDLTISQKQASKLEIMETFKKHCKKWCFQLEKGEKTGYMHYQCRISLKTKKRMNQVIMMFQHLKANVSITSKANRDNNFYVLKEDTKVEGAWTESKNDLPEYIPRQIREIKKLYPFQKQIIRMSEEWDTRTIHIVIDIEGNKGKTTISQYLHVYKKANIIPFCNDYKDLMRMVLCMPKLGCYMIDLPRAINKERLYQLFSAIETIKGGYAYDDRYSFKSAVFDCPQIFVFTNIRPDTKLMTKDRWKFWNIQNKRLVPEYNYPEQVKSCIKEIRKFLGGSRPCNNIKNFIYNII